MAGTKHAECFDIWISGYKADKSLKFFMLSFHPQARIRTRLKESRNNKKNGYVDAFFKLIFFDIYVDFNFAIS
jgi:hypothetical protein